MPQMVKKTLGTGDRRWLASAHGIRNCRSSVLDVSAFTLGTHFPDGYFPSGLIVNCANEQAVVPFTGAAGEVFGVLFDDVETDGVEDLNVPIFRHGGINTAYLPVATNLPTTAPAGFFFVSPVTTTTTTAAATTTTTTEA